MAKQSNKRVRVASSDQVSTRTVNAQIGLPARRSKTADNATAIQAALGIIGTGVELKKESDDEQFALRFNKARLQQEQLRIQQEADAISDEAAGTRAAQTGEVTEENLSDKERSAAYVLGAEAVIGRGRALEDGRRMTADFERDFDKRGDLADADEWINEWQKNNYEGMSQGIATVAAPELINSRERLLDSYGQEQTAEIRAEVRNGLNLGMVAFVKDPDADFHEWYSRRNEYTATLGKTAGNLALANDVASGILSAGDERLLDNPIFKLLRTNPATRDILSRA